MKKALVFVAVLLIILVFVQVAMAEPAFDPQSLIGEWWGEWRTLNGASSGKIYITVEKVNGNKVFGVAEATGADNYLRYERFEGTLEEKVLSITLSKLWFRLTITGKTMEGNARGGQESNLKLERK